MEEKGKGWTVSWEAKKCTSVITSIKLVEVPGKQAAGIQYHPQGEQKKGRPRVLSSGCVGVRVERGEMI